MKLSLPACLRACTTQSVYHSRRKRAYGTKSMDFRHRGRFHKRITGAQQTQKEPLLLTARSARRARSASGDFATYIAGEHSERSPLVYIYDVVDPVFSKYVNLNCLDLGKELFVSKCGDEILINKFPS